jgi:hypothetical protein
LLINQLRGNQLFAVRDQICWCLGDTIGTERGVTILSVAGLLDWLSRAVAIGLDGVTCEAGVGGGGVSDLDG